MDKLLYEAKILQLRFRMQGMICCRQVAYFNKDTKTLDECEVEFMRLSNETKKLIKEMEGK